MDLFKLCKGVGSTLFSFFLPTFPILTKIILLFVILLLCVAYLVYWERKLIGWFHARVGPNRVGPFGLFQTIVDVLKLLTKEVICPDRASSYLYFIAPMMVAAPAFSLWAVIPIGEKAVIADINVGLVYVLAVSSIGVYGTILAGWASNSRYAFLGAMRASSQMISYEMSISFALVTVLIISGSLNLSDIVLSQGEGIFARKGFNILSWNWIPLFPMFIIHFISGLAETGRHPFDVIEGESEIVGGHMVDYSGIAFALFFLAEYLNMITVSALSTVLFLGGWSPPLAFLSFIPSFIWFSFKVFLLLSLFVWIRATFPRFRYDQIMRLGWKFFLPISILWLLFVSAWTVYF